MQKILTKFLLPIHLGLLLLASWLFWVHASFPVFVALFWFSFLVAETAILLPSVRRGETLADARARVRYEVLRDPFLYLGLALVLFSFLQWLNGGCKLIYLPDADVWEYSPPAVPGAPFCVEPLAAMSQTSVFLCGWVGCLVLRHAISQNGRRYFFRYAVAVSGLLAVYMSLRSYGGSEPYVGWALGKTTSIVGAFFGFWLVLAFGALADALVRDAPETPAVFALGVVGNLVGVIVFAPTWTLLVYLLVSLWLFVYLFLFLHKQVSPSKYWKLFVVSMVAVATIGLACFFPFPGNPLPSKMKATQSWEQTWRALSETKHVRSSAALKIWQDHPWVGVGADGFRHFVGTSVGEKEWHQIKVAPSEVYNDCLQFLCEYGLLGFGLFLSCVLMLAFSCFHRACSLLKRGKDGVDNTGATTWFVRFPPVFFVGNLAACVCVCACWFSNQFTSPSLLISWLFVLAALPGFLPGGVRR